MDGELSIDGQWIWNASSAVWEVDPAIANSFNAPDNTTGKARAINYHPSQEPEQGIAYYPRLSMRGENNGWQTCTVTGNDGDVLLFKDDLIWRSNYYESSEPIDFFRFDDFFNGTRELILDNGKSLYDDIFQNGFIQS